MDEFDPMDETWRCLCCERLLLTQATSLCDKCEECSEEAEVVMLNHLAQDGSLMEAVQLAMLSAYGRGRTPGSASFRLSPEGGLLLDMGVLSDTPS